MHILFLADAVYEDLPGGSRVVAREIARGLIERGHQVTFLVARQKESSIAEEQWHEGIRIVRYHGAGQCFDYLHNGEDACGRIGMEKPFDLVHTHFAYAAVGPLRAVPRHIPRIRTFHGPWDEEGWLEDTAYARGPKAHLTAILKKQMRRAVEASNLRRSDAVVTLSDCFRAHVTQRFGISEERVHTIPGGTDVVRFVPTADKTALRCRLNLPLHRRLMLSIRRLCPRMGLDNLIAAMPAVIARHPDLLLLIGGQGTEREHLERLIQERKLENHVRLIGFIPDGKLASYYQSVDLFVLPTLALEGFGLVTTEALACGTPVIGTHIGATPEILCPLEPQWIIPGTSPQALAKTILGFWAEERPRSLSPTQLHEYISRHYTWDRHIGQLEAIYEGALSKSRHYSQKAEKSSEEKLALS